jgi:tetratricopeptide (TPR) repeat protein
MPEKHTNADTLFDRGIGLMQEEKYKEAIQAFEKVLQLDPDHEKTWFHMGYCYDNLYNSDKAVECYEKAIEADSCDYEAYYNLGNKYLDISDPLFDDEEYGDYPKAIEYYKKTLEIKPDFGFAWNNMGFCYSKMEEHEKALECHLKAVKYSPDNQSAWMNLGIDYFFLRDHLKAIESYEKAIDLDPEDNMAWVCLRTTVESYKSKHPLSNVNKEMWLRIGGVYITLGKFEKAVECFKELIILDRVFWGAWHQLGYVYHLLKDHHKFMKFFEDTEKIMKKIIRISIITTSAGPLYPDLYWLLESGSGITIVPLEGPDETFLGRIQTMEGFDNKAVITAMSSTEDNIFVCWEKG